MTDYYLDEEYEGVNDGDDDRYLDDPDEPDEASTGRFGRTRLPTLPRVGRMGRPTGLAEVEGSTTWSYLGLLGLLFLVIVVTSRACAPEAVTPTDLLPVDGDGTVEAGEVAVRLTVAVDGDVVRLTGAVPDEGARQQVLAAAATLYGAENVIDELTVDPATTVDAGVLAMTGSVVFGDDRPAQLRDAITSGLGLAVGEFAVQEGDAVVRPVEVRAELNGDTISFAGVIPDNGSVIELTAAGEAIWGAGSVDVSGVTVSDDVAWTEGTVVLTGVATPGDQRYIELPGEIQSRFGNLVTVDITGVTVDTGPEAIATVQASIAEAVRLQPITFAANSAEIDASSDGVLATIAEQLQLLPQVTVEVSGHTDDLGAEDVNLSLSQLRAEAVVSRLGELGVDPARLTARGAGESEPVADNSTSEGRAQNRRIEFVLGGG